MGRQLLIRVFTRLSVYKWKCDLHSTRKCLFYVCVLPASEKMKFSDKEHLILMGWLLCLDKNKIAVSQS